MAERIKLSCQCGAALEAESNLRSMLYDSQRSFQEEHRACLTQALEAQQSAATPSERSSAPTPGPALRLFEWLRVNRPSSQGQLVLTAKIWDSFKSTSFTAHELEEMLPYFSTLLSTSESPTPSGQNKDGAPGRVDPDHAPLGWEEK